MASYEIADILDPFSDIFDLGSIFWYFCCSETEKPRILNDFSDIFEWNRKNDPKWTFPDQKQRLTKLCVKLISLFSLMTSDDGIRAPL